jgi:hypothetical protein
MQVQDATRLIQMEYAEMPGLQLTFWQAQRLWNLSEELCDRALNTLIRAGVLVRTSDGRYTRHDAGRSGADAPRPSGLTVSIGNYPVGSVEA